MPDLLQPILDYWKSGGPLLIPLAALSFFMLRRLITLRRRLQPALNGQQDYPLEALRRDFIMVAALTAAAPLIGLLGTVSGMMSTFDAVGQGALAEKQIAEGISRALITTQLGLVVAIPGVFGLARVRRLWTRARALCHEVQA